MNLKPYEVTTKETAKWKNIPIVLLDDVKEYLKKKNLNFVIRYRGERTNPNDKRWGSSRWRTCAKQFANRFSVYIKD